jgi:hypothetical protein
MVTTMETLHESRLSLSKSPDGRCLVCRDPIPPHQRFYCPPPKPCASIGRCLRRKESLKRQNNARHQRTWRRVNKTLLLARRTADRLALQLYRRLGGSDKTLRNARYYRQVLGDPYVSRLIGHVSLSPRGHSVDLDPNACPGGRTELDAPFADGWYFYGVPLVGYDAKGKLAVFIYLFPTTRPEDKSHHVINAISIRRRLGHFPEKRPWPAGSTVRLPLYMVKAPDGFEAFTFLLWTLVKWPTQASRNLRHRKPSRVRTERGWAKQLR